MVKNREKDCNNCLCLKCAKYEECNEACDYCYEISSIKPIDECFEFKGGR